MLRRNATAGQEQSQKGCLMGKVTCKEPACHRLLPPMHLRETLSLSCCSSDRLAGLKCTVSCCSMVSDLQEGFKP